MAKKITQEDLRKKIGKGAKVDTVVPPKPKRKPKPLIKEQVADGLNDTSKAITKMADVITGAFEKQNDQLADKFEQIVSKEVVVNLPKQVKTKKKTHVFKVKRDHRGFIEEIIAREI